MEKESQANQSNAKEDSQSEKVHAEDLSTPDYISKLEKEIARLNLYLDASRQEHNLVMGRIWCLAIMGRHPLATFFKWNCEQHV